MANPVIGDSPPSLANVVNNSSFAQALYRNKFCNVSCMSRSPCDLRVARVAQGAALHFHAGQNMSDYSFLILALAAWKNGAQTAHKT
jgi:hypothetical protein